MRSYWLLLSVMLVAGCASPQALSTDDYRALIPALQERVAAAPQDVTALNDLGEALAQAGEFEQAYETLLMAERLDGGDPRRYYYIGLIEESLGNQAKAIVRYQDAPLSSPYKQRMDERAAWLLRKEARENVAAPATNEYPREEAVAVLPFEYRGSDPFYRPLGRGLSELLAADLVATGRIHVVESVQMYRLVAEFGLDPADISEARAQQLGRDLRSSHTVVGAVEVQYEAIFAEAALVTSDGTASPELTLVEGPLVDLFRLEKELATAIIQDLGIALTAAERERLARIPTRDLSAFLLYSRGLLEEDAGRFDEAAALYASALSRDPGFLVAARRAEEVRALPTALGVDRALAELRVADIRPVAQDLTTRRLATLSRSLNGHFVPGEGARNPTAEAAPTTRQVEPFPAPPPPPTTGGN